MKETDISKGRPHLRNSVLPVSVEFLLWKCVGCVSIPSLWLLMLVLREVKQRQDQDSGQFHWGVSIQVSFLVTVSSGKWSLSLVSSETLDHRQCLLLAPHPLPSWYAQLISWIVFPPLLLGGNPLHTRDSVYESWPLWVGQGKKKEMENAESATFC